MRVMKKRLYKLGSHLHAPELKKYHVPKRINSLGLMVRKFMTLQMRPDILIWI